MRRLGRIGLVLGVVIGLLVACQPTRVALQTAIMLPNLLGSGPQPLTWFSQPPQRSAIAYRDAADGTPELAELWLPAWASSQRQAGAVLLVLGVNSVGRNHPVVERVADALARTGAAVLVPDSQVLLEGRLEPGEIDGVVLAFEALAARPEVDPERLGIAGFSVGGSLSLLAARDPRIADEVRWVNAFGAYADAATYLAAVSAHAYRDAGATVAWTPSDLALAVYLRLVLERVDDAADRALLDGAFRDQILAGALPVPDAVRRASLRTDAGRAVHDLLTASSLDAADMAIGELPAASLDFLDALSPVRHLDGLKADVFVMHELTDHHVPVVESRVLASALEPLGLLRGSTEFRLFDHVQPDDVDLLAAAPELVKLLLHVRALMGETL